MAHLFYGIWNGEILDGKKKAGTPPTNADFETFDDFNEGNPVRAFFGDEQDSANSWLSENSQPGQIHDALDIRYFHNVRANIPAVVRPRKRGWEPAAPSCAVVRPCGWARCS